MSILDAAGSDRLDYLGQADDDPLDLRDSLIRRSGSELDALALLRSGTGDGPTEHARIGSIGAHPGTRSATATRTSHPHEGQRTDRKAARSPAATGAADVIARLPGGIVVTRVLHLQQITPTGRSALPRLGRFGAVIMRSG